MLRSSALAAISLPTYAEKLQATESIDIAAPLDTRIVLQAAAIIPGREALPRLVPPGQLRRRSMATVEGRAILIHALAHIELNAIDLGLDIVWRFPDMPQPFYRDWIRVAQEEAGHFRLLSDHLNGLGYRYGDFPAHNGLWEMAEKTSQDLLARLALVPRTLEARGLDAAVPIRDKLLQVGDHQAAGILDIILRDEIGHVAVGNRWYKSLCAQHGLDPRGDLCQLGDAIRGAQVAWPVQPGSAAGSRF